MKGIVFSEPMVRAWLEGRKSVTRRLVKVSSEWEPGYTHCVGDVIQDVHFYGGPDGDCIVKPPYLPGETVYIKETWGAIDLESGYALIRQPKSKEGIEIVYRAGCNDFIDSLVHTWFTPRFMPEWASRGHILIGGVKPERVQAITEEDAIKEGFHNPGDPDFNPLFPFIGIWDSLYPGSWERNDWVWRIELEAV